MMARARLDELLLGGPGHDGYAYNADVYCVECGKAIITELWGGGHYDDGDSGDSNYHPQPIFGGESDTAQYCGDCGEYLYGPQEEPEDVVEPDEGDYTTTDHVHFYQHGKLVLTVEGGADGDRGKAVKAHMEKEQYWPNVWFVSDHGNAHLINLDG